MDLSRDRAAPMQAGDGGQPDIQFDREPGRSTRSPMVLVVDDELPLRELLARMLARHRFVPVTAESAADAMTAAVTHEIDAVIVDLGLRGGDSGLDIVQWLRSQPRYRRTPVLILTGRIALAESEEALIRRHGAYVFYKPTPFAELIRYLQRLTSQQYE
jgi:DNA-binding response OmpR family regulator